MKRWRSKDGDASKELNHKEVKRKGKAKRNYSDLCLSCQEDLNPLVRNVEIRDFNCFLLIRLAGFSVTDFQQELLYHFEFNHNVMNDRPERLIEIQT